MALKPASDGDEDILLNADQSIPEEGVFAMDDSIPLDLIPHGEESVAESTADASVPYRLPDPISWDEVDQGFIDIDFVFPGLTVGGLGMMAAPGGTGKSFSMLALAASVAMGRRLLEDWPEHEPAKALVFFAEDPSEIVHNRLRALSLTNWVRSEDRQDDRSALLRQNLVVRSMVGVSSILGQSGRFDKSMHASDFAKHIEAEALACNARLIILDPLRQFHVGDENDSADMTELLKLMHGIAYRTGCSIIFAHHTNKNATLAGQGDSQQAARGSSAITDNVRWQANMTLMQEDECKKYNIPVDQRKNYVRMSLSKANYTANSDDVWFKRGMGGILEPITLTEFNVRTDTPLDFGISDDPTKPIRSGRGGRRSASPKTPPMFGTQTQGIDV